MANERGFTLIETLIATAILVPGLVAIAWVFAYGVSSTASSQQTTAGTIILMDKMEQLRATDLTNAALTAGGGLNPASPANGYFDYVTINADGTIASDTTTTDAPYLRLWQISGSNPKTITIIVYAQRNRLTRDLLELVRSTTIMTNN